MRYFWMCTGSPTEQKDNAWHSRTDSEAHALPNLLDLILRNKGDHGMRRDAEVVCWESCPETRDSTHLDLFHRAIDGALEWHLARNRIWLRLLYLRLDKVEGQAEERREESCDGACAEDLDRHGSTNRLEHLLTLGIECKHAEIQGHGASCCGRGSLEKAGGALVAGDGSQSVADSTVVPALCLWEHRVSLHADESQVSRVAHDSCNTSCA
mmetsp:Transcript_84903/g.149890  ORF Transcript_84903/g.149890 Transcript_84903/m.149890 type:complete len:211 (+) Transcript_84903:61-693(+)